MKKMENGLYTFLHQTKFTKKPILKTDSETVNSHNTFLQDKKALKGSMNLAKKSEYGNGSTKMALLI